MYEDYMITNGVLAEDQDRIQKAFRVFDDGLIAIPFFEERSFFTARWTRGRACPVCMSLLSSNGDTGVVASIRACAEPMQACAPL